MARIFLIDGDSVHATDLTAVLQRHSHRVVAMSPEEARHDLATILDEAEIVVVNVTTDSQRDWDLLRDVCHLAAMFNFGPQILAVSRTYRGPTARLRAEKLGGRLIYG
jgi:hypothetical protein